MISSRDPACSGTGKGWRWRFLKKGADAFIMIMSINEAVLS